MSLSKLIARAWTDQAFKNRLMNEPAAALAEYGFEIPNGASVKVVEDTPDMVHLVLPAVPENADRISMSELESVAGGTNNLMPP